jgi:hypothetical protein
MLPPAASNQLNEKIKLQPAFQVRGIVDAWYQNENRAVWILLGLFVVDWTTFHIIANASVGLHTDSLEMYTWAQHLRPGYPEHPPLGALMLAAWFAVFPATDWSFHLLGMVHAAAALYAVDIIAVSASP